MSSHGSLLWYDSVVILTKFHQWLHRKLSKWQLPVQPIAKISSTWRHLHFSDCMVPNKESQIKQFHCTDHQSAGYTTTSVLSLPLQWVIPFTSQYNKWSMCPLTCNGLSVPQSWRVMGSPSHRADVQWALHPTELTCKGLSIPQNWRAMGSPSHRADVQWVLHPAELTCNGLSVPQSWRAKGSPSRKADVQWALHPTELMCNGLSIPQSWRAMGSPSHRADVQWALHPAKLTCNGLSIPQSWRAMSSPSHRADVQWALHPTELTCNGLSTQQSWRTVGSPPHRADVQWAFHPTELMCNKFSIPQSWRAMGFPSRRADVQWALHPAELTCNGLSIPQPALVIQQYNVHSIGIPTTTQKSPALHANGHLTAFSDHSVQNTLLSMSSGNHSAREPFCTEFTPLNSHPEQHLCHPLVIRWPFKGSFLAHALFTSMNSIYIMRRSHHAAVNLHGNLGTGRFAHTNLSIMHGTMKASSYFSFLTADLNRKQNHRPWPGCHQLKQFHQPPTWCPVGENRQSSVRSTSFT